MANKKSLRTMQARQNYDQVSFLAEKGSRDLLRVVAMREGVTVSELLRRCILSAAGLNVFPPPSDLEDLAAIETSKDADAAILKMQSKENLSDDLEEHKNKHKNDRYISTLNPDEWELILGIGDRIDEELTAQTKVIQEHPSGDAMFSSIQITMTSLELAQLHRIVANIRKYIDPDEV